MFQMPNNPMQIIQQAKSLEQQFRKSGQNPQQVVQNLLNNGQMTQQQFNQLRNMANQITGMRF